MLLFFMQEASDPTEWQANIDSIVESLRASHYQWNEHRLKFQETKDSENLLRMVEKESEFGQTLITLTCNFLPEQEVLESFEVYNWMINLENVQFSDVVLSLGANKTSLSKLLISYSQMHYHTLTCLSSLNEGEKEKEINLLCGENFGLFAKNTVNIIKIMAKSGSFININMPDLTQSLFLACSWLLGDRLIVEP